MRNAWNQFRNTAGRFKLIAALLGIFLGGAMLAMGTSTWHYTTAINNIQRANNARTIRLYDDIDFERNINRKELVRLAALLEANTNTLRSTTTKADVTARKTQTTADTMSAVGKIQQATSKDVKKAAAAATSAAQDISEALTPVAKKPSGEVPDWLNTP